jgi:hypothetical protein
MSWIFFSRFQSCKIIPIVITPAFGSGSLKKPPDAMRTRLLNPDAEMCFFATGSTRE